jgi:hypothetical protein
VLTGEMSFATFRSLDFDFVMRGLDPRIHDLTIFLQERRGWPGRRRNEAPPFFERLCPAMTL